MRHRAILVGLLFASCGGPEPRQSETTTLTGGVGNPAGSSGMGMGGMAGGGTSAAGSGAAGTGGNVTGAYCDAWVARIRECGSLGEGRYAGCTNHGDPVEACEVACIQSASCTAVVDFFCGLGAEIFDCQGACIGELPVVCSDGMRYSYDYRCDGIDDCVNGEEEAGCTATGTVKCRNVDQRIASTAVCDGVADCSDGSDEPAGCSDTFTCTDGTPLPALYACDGFVDCADESDEPSDCARAACE